MMIGSMRVRFHAHDREPLEFGLDKLHKMAENVVKMSTFMRIESGAAARCSAACDRAKTLILTVAERSEGFTGEVEVADDIREAMYTAALAWLRRCNDNVIPEQTKLTIGMSDVEKRRTQVENLRDRLEGKLGIFDAIGSQPAAPIEEGADDDELADPDDSLWDEGPEAHRTGPALVGEPAPAGSGTGKVEVPAGVASAAAARKARGGGLK